MAHKHSVYDTDTHFSINPVTRLIKNESSRKTTLIQYDHNSERFTFELPRYIEGHDMSICNKVEIHFLNIDAVTKRQNSGFYTVDDLQISPEDDSVVVCSWLVSKNATQLVGSLNFIVRFRCVEDDVTVYSWNSAVYSGISVSNGIHAGETLETEYLDVIEQWKAKVTQEITDDVNENVSEAIAEGFRKQRMKVYAENETASDHGIFEGVNYAGQGERSDLYGFIIHNYTDSPIMRLDNVGSGSIIQAVNAHNAVRRSDKDAAFYGNGDVLRYIVQADPNGDGEFTQHLLFKIDKDGMLWWSGWDNANAGNEAQNKTVKFQTNKLDGGVWAFNFDAVNLNKYLLLLTSGGFQVVQIKTADDGSCVIEAPNGMRVTGKDYLNLTSDGNIVIQTASADVLNAIRFRINGTYYHPQFTNKICTSNNRPSLASAGEIYLESDTNRTIRRNAANNGWVDMNGNAV